MRYHRGEREIQERLGLSAEAGRSARVMRDGLSDVLAAFLGTQRLVVTGSADAGGDVWASVLTGPPGFARATGPRSLSLALDRSRFAAPLGDAAGGPFEIGLLFADSRTGLRLRVNGTARPSARGLAVDTAQIFTNCPGRLRDWSGPGPLPLPRGEVFPGDALGAAQRRWIAEAGTFFVASASDTGAADASHRGGAPGFVEVVSPTELSWAEYPGNSMFTTLGNLTLNPRAGVVFVDARHGATLHLTGTARVRLAQEGPVVRFRISRVLQAGPSREPESGADGPVGGTG
ncbi:pyridoxamine 5'-phosphate oxidase family protein [Streptomyces sp. SID8352]|uniref:pyridoxamine 5'-phosphate oxidase family protein n=1 Tax=Streptomyces sp. SID8352 TaxID=2690338 RepID=UPI00136B5E7A|nr:pyridoxamine 5'-phosphate oxidase family protein [Streptomyces sp. SID8352]